MRKKRRATTPPSPANMAAIFGWGFFENTRFPIVVPGTSFKSGVQHQKATLVCGENAQTFISQACLFAGFRQALSPISSLRTTPRTPVSTPCQMISTPAQATPLSTASTQRSDKHTHSSDPAQHCIHALPNDKHTRPSDPAAMYPRPAK